METGPCRDLAKVSLPRGVRVIRPPADERRDFSPCSSAALQAHGKHGTILGRAPSSSLCVLQRQGNAPEGMLTQAESAGKRRQADAVDTHQLWNPRGAALVAGCNIGRRGFCSLRRV